MPEEERRRTILAVGRFHRRHGIPDQLGYRAALDYGRAGATQRYWRWCQRCVEEVDEEEAGL